MARNGQQLTETDRHGQKRRETDRHRQKQTETDRMNRNGQKQPETDRKGHRRTETDRNEEKQTGRRPLKQIGRFSSPGATYTYTKIASYRLNWPSWSISENGDISALGFKALSEEQGLR